MELYLNKRSNFEQFTNDVIYVDKTELIKTTNFNLNKPSSKFMCVTRPRRFGKTMALSMLNSYYSKGASSKAVFDEFNIAKESDYLTHLNKHNVIWVDMASLYTSLKDKTQFVDSIKDVIARDLRLSYPDVDFGDFKLNEMFILLNSLRNETFIFLIDEWDVIFREKPNSPICDEYIELLRNLFKSSDVSDCFELVYMTGILPIKRYSTQSTLNMFKEYNMIYSGGIAEHLGFTESEVKQLCSNYGVDFQTMKKWYDGYRLDGFEIYNPKSVVEAIMSKKFADYWTSTSAIEAITNYMDYDNGVLKETITRMLSGEEVPVDVSLFENDLTSVDSQDAALTILIHLGYLAYNEEKKSCYIPNYEISKEFENALKKLNWHEIYNPIANSMKLYEETLKGNTEFINETLEKNHKELASAFNKNKEDVLGIVVHISYHDIAEWYYVRKEDTCSTGRADITYSPKDGTHIPIIVELKADAPVEKAISQIKDRDYASIFKGYKGKILLLGISYNSKSLKYDSKVEYIEL